MPNHQTFLSANSRFQLTRAFHRTQWDVDLPCPVCTVWLVQQILKVHWEAAYHQYQTSCTSYRYIPCFCMLYITRTAVVSLSHSICARDKYHTMHLQDVHSANGSARHYVYRKRFRRAVTF
jgi:hypothetical protein